MMVAVHPELLAEVTPALSQTAVMNSPKHTTKARANPIRNSRQDLSELKVEELGRDVAPCEDVDAYTEGHPQKYSARKSRAPSE